MTTAAAPSPVPFSPERLRGHRDGTSTTQEALAKALGCSTAVIRDYEDHRATPPRSHIEGMARAMGLPPAALARQSDNDIREYCQATASHAAPMNIEDLKAVEAVLRRAPR